MTEKKPEPFLVNQRVRLNRAARESEWGKNSPEHLEEFQDSVGVIVGLMQWSNTTEPGPEYEVRWYYSSRCGPTRLHYCYAPEHLSLVMEKEAAPDDIRHSGRLEECIEELIKERDLLKLRVVWREREVIFEIRRSLSHVSEAHLARYRAAVKDMEEAKTAYLAAGGKE